MDFGRILDAKWEVFGGQNHRKNRCFFGSVFGGLRKHRRGCGGAAGGAAGGVLSAADAPGERHFIKDYIIITHQNTICTLEILEIAASLTRRWAVGPANYF